ncbi:MAG TPA: hypothetical protein VJG48_00715 [Candidatus Paceibacterota bacterium]
MPRTAKTDPFFIYAAKKSGSLKGKRLLGVNHCSEERKLTLQDLLKFLAKNGIQPSDVELPGSFTTCAKVR